jgi:hypothetical protein
VELELLRQLIHLRTSLAVAVSLEWECPLQAMVECPLQAMVECRVECRVE